MPYEVICDEKELISISEENFTQRDVESKQLKEENEKLRKENDNEYENENENGNKNEQFNKIT